LKQLQWTVIKKADREYPLISLELLTDSEHKFIIRSAYYINADIRPKVTEYNMKSTEVSRLWTSAITYHQRIMDSF
jgi:hypothetical protein